MMPMKSKIPTDDLFLMLESETDLVNNWENISEHMDAGQFNEYLAGLISDRNITTREFIIKTLLSRSFTYQILSGDRIPSRNILLRIAVSIGMSVDETQRMLKLADRGALYPKVKRDAAIIYALSNKYSLYETDELLVSLGQESLL